MKSSTSVIVTQIIGSIVLVCVLVYVILSLNGVYDNKCLEIQELEARIQTLQNQNEFLNTLSVKLQNENTEMQTQLDFFLKQLETCEMF